MERGGRGEPLLGWCWCLWRGYSEAASADVKNTAKWIQLLLQEGTAIAGVKICSYRDAHRNRKQSGRSKSLLPPPCLQPPAGIVYAESLVAQTVKNLPAMWETWVQSLEEEMATHSTILAWRIPWTEGLVVYSPWGCKELDATEWLTLCRVDRDQLAKLKCSLQSPSPSIPESIGRWVGAKIACNWHNNKQIN